MNKVILMGRLTRDPEMRYTANNTPVTSFSIAVDRTYKRPGEPTADFVNIVAWSKTAEFVAKWFTKGLKVIVSGRLQIRPWQDKTGAARTAVEIVAEEVHFADSKNSAHNNNNTGIEGYNPGGDSQTMGYGYPDPTSLGLSVDKDESDFSEIIDDGGEIPF